MKTIVATVAHEKSLPFHSALVESIEAQTDLDFEVLTVTDGVSVETPSRRWHIKPESGTVAQIRKAMIRHCIALKADAVILIDGDDLMKNDRIAIVKKALAEGEEIVFNDLHKFKTDSRSSQPWLSKILADNQQISFSEIINGNCLGFSNTAFRTRSLPDSVFDISDSISLFDWAFFSRFLLKIPSATFKAAAVTYYRQYSDNIATFEPTEAEVIRTLEYKAAHFKDLAKVSPGVEPLHDRARHVLQLIQSKQKNWSELIRNPLDPSGKQMFWWEAVDIGA